MASPVSLAKRRAVAAGRVDAALTVLADRYGLEVDPDALGGHGRDQDIAQTRQVEAFADVLDQLSRVATQASRKETER